jgi:hypothetical protein
MKRVILLTTVLLAFEWAVFAQTQSSKKGIAFGYHTAADMAAISKGMSWWYNWAVVPEDGVKDVFGSYNMDFVPMAWNGLFDEASLRAFYESHPDAEYLMGFNEPNFVKQANLTPGEAAALWPKLEAIAKDFNLNWITISDNANPIPEAFPENQRIIYPNPVTDILNIQSDDLTPEATVTIINQTGVVLLTKEFHRGTNSMSIDVSNLKSGLFFVKVKKQTEISNYRFVKQ